MHKALTEALASSSAHGISRAAGSKATPLRVMWVLLFTLFLALFLKSGIKLAMKLKEDKLTKVYHLDQVPFVFPDLYFCPRNPYSGSYPFVLTANEAEAINSKIAEIITHYKELLGSNHGKSDAPLRASFVQTSLPFYLLTGYLALRKEQSVLKATLTSNFETVEVEMQTFYHPENLVCFRANLTDKMKSKMMSFGSVIDIWLSTDPYFHEFGFTGHQIKPIVDCTNQSIPFLSWHPSRFVEDLKVSGYTILFVPPGAYPSMRFEHQFHLAPGNAYSVTVRMEENACSEELHGTHCVAKHAAVDFTNPLTGRPEPFTYSTAACYLMHKNADLTKSLGCQISSSPMPWKFRAWPCCLNASQIKSQPSIIAKMIAMSMEDVIKRETQTLEHCKARVPCVHPQYFASHSFGKWPGAGSATEHFFAKHTKFDEKVAPALARISAIAQQILAGNGSIHLKEFFHAYLSEAMVSVSISIASMMAPQVVLTGAYSFTDFLADIGGLLGLYIGCSVLTLCELLEVLYVLLRPICSRISRNRASRSGRAATRKPTEANAKECDVLTPV